MKKHFFLSILFLAGCQENLQQKEPLASSNGDTKKLETSVTIHNIQVQQEGGRMEDAMTALMPIGTFIETPARLTDAQFQAVQQIWTENNEKPFATKMANYLSVMLLNKYDLEKAPTTDKLTGTDAKVIAWVLDRMAEKDVVNPVITAKALARLDGSLSKQEIAKIANEATTNATKFLEAQKDCKDCSARNDEVRLGIDRLKSLNSGY